MPFNIEKFRSAVNHYGNARHYNYEVFITMPRGMREGSPEDQRRKFTHFNQDMPFFCESVNFPTTGINPYPVRRFGYGAVETKPSFPVFSQMQCNFLVDENSTMQQFFHDWMKVVINFDYDNVGIDGSSTKTINEIPMSTYEIGYKLDYSIELRLVIYNSVGDVVREVFFREAYPIKVDSINYNYAHTNDIIKLPVTFTFFDWYELTREFYR